VGSVGEPGESLVEWPRPGEVLFTDSPTDGRNNACLNFGADFWTGYARGYRKGGRILTDWVIERGRDHDYLVYPIVFMYHHHLELSMKELIRKGEQLLGSGDDFKPDHNLSRQWIHCRRVIEQVYSDAIPEVLDAIGQQLSQLTALDSQLAAFRYPYERDGQTPSLPAEFRRFNLRHFAECIERVSDVLDASCTGIEAALEEKHGSLAALGDYFE
jgi:hypothetical protein